MKIIVIGTSLGGMTALKTLFAGLPPDFNAAILVVWHTAPESPELLSAILQRVASFPVSSAQDGQTLEAGRAYIARPDYHLAVELGSALDNTTLNGSTPVTGRIRLTHGPKENRFRPSIDVLFRSAAVAFGNRVIGVVLTGALDDGASGLFAVKELGGIAIVQDPLDAECPNMPINAMRAVKVDHVLPIGEIGKVLARLANGPFLKEGESAMSKSLNTEVRIALGDSGLESGVQELGRPSTFACPECHGNLLQIKEGNRNRFRCHTGHAYSLDTLLVDLTKSQEEMLWCALRSLQETEILLGQIAEHLQESGESEAAQGCLTKAQGAKQRGDLVREVILQNEVLSEDTFCFPKSFSERTD